MHLCKFIVINFYAIMVSYGQLQNLQIIHNNASETHVPNSVVMLIIREFTKEAITIWYIN